MTRRNATWKLLALLADEVRRHESLELVLACSYVMQACGCSRSAAHRALQRLMDEGVLEFDGDVISAQGRRAPRAFRINPQRYLFLIDREHIGTTKDFLNLPYILSSGRREVTNLDEGFLGLSCTTDKEADEFLQFAQIELQAKEYSPRAREGFVRPALGRMRELNQHDLCRDRKLGQAAAAILFQLDRVGHSLSAEELRALTGASRWTVARKLDVLRRAQLVRHSRGRWRLVAREWGTLREALKNCSVTERFLGRRTSVSLTRRESPCLSGGGGVFSEAYGRGSQGMSKPKSASGVGANLAIRYFHDRYREIFGTRFSQTTDQARIAAGNFNRIVADIGLTEVKVRIEAYFAEEWPRKYGGYTMLGFVKHHASVATKEIAIRLREWFSLTDEQREQCEKALAFFCRRHLERRKSPYVVPGDKRMVALRSLGSLVRDIEIKEIRRRMAAYIDDDWTANHGGIQLSKFIKDHQNFAAKARDYARPASWDTWRARHGESVFPSTVKKYPGTSTPLFLGVDEDE